MLRGASSRASKEKAKAKEKARERARAGDRLAVVTPLTLTRMVTLAPRGPGHRAEARARAKASAISGRHMGSAGATSARTGMMEDPW